MSDKSRYFEPLALAVASGSTIRDAATAARCAESTAYRVSQSEEFRQRVSEIRSELTFQAVGRLSALACEAVDTLALLLDLSQEPSTRLAASKAILTHLGPLSEFGELRKRIDELEQK